MLKVPTGDGKTDFTKFSRLTSDTEEWPLDESWKMGGGDLVDVNDVHKKKSDLKKISNSSVSWERYM